MARDRDPRTYITVHDGFFEHPKTVKAGGDASWLDMCSWGYCSRNLTDGMIPKAHVPRISDRKQPMRLAAKLVAVGRWHTRGHDCPRCAQPADDEYVVHDYLHHQRSAAEVAAYVQERKLSSLKANHQRWHVKGKKPDPECQLCVDQNLVRPGSVDGQGTDPGMESVPGSETPPFSSPEAVAVAEKNTLTHLGKSAPVGNAPEGGVPGAAESIVIEWTDRCDRMPPGKVINGVGVEVAQMLREGVDADHIREGLAAWARRGGLGPGVLPSFVNDVMNRPAGQVALRNGTNGQAVSTTDQRVGAALALADQYREENR
jgi:hypothetical protein